jgi:thiosulfate reductase cytochrome b subunit
MVDAATTSPGVEPPASRLHPGALRIMHWINALAMIIMIGSGWKIYDNQPIFSWLWFHHTIVLGGDPDTAYKFHGDGGYAGGIAWHFFGMWVLIVNGLAYIAYGFATGRFRRKLIPVRPSEVLSQIGDALRFRLKHDDITVYNAVQRLLYLGIIAVIVIQVLSGLAIWKPVQFPWLAGLFYDFQTARLAHFFGMSAIVAFLGVHVTLALIVPQTLLAMITGGPRVGKPSRHSAEEMETQNV